MSAFSFKTITLSVGLAVAILSCDVRANEDMFPAATTAAAAVTFDGKGFIIHGKREFVASGSIHYPRVPRELWRDRLLQLKRAGFNTVETYVFWNFHETRKGEIDLTTGAHDLGAFLQTAQEVGLYAIVRVGPYVCAEWESGGYPVWLRNEPDLKVRSDNPAFLKAVDHFWDRMIPIVAAHQINRGGNVILVQLENEDPQGWGTVMPTSYFTHLQKKALDMGIEVPHFFSGLHHGTDPAGYGPWDSGSRKTPWFSTETWIRWYDVYGNASPSALAEYQHNIWNIVANGGNGFNLYMFHGGTNFDYWNDDDSDSSYDYGTLVGQAGDLRNLYYSVKRAVTFATSFPDILENSVNYSTTKFASVDNITTGTPPKAVASVKVVARKSPDGTVMFVRNTQKTPQTATLQSGKRLALDPYETAPLLVDTPLAPGIRIKSADVSTLGLATHGNTTTWIIYGKPQEKGRLEFDLDQDGVFSPPAPASGFVSQTGDPKHLGLDVVFSESAPGEFLFTVGGRTLRILAETTAWTDRTWIVGKPGAASVVTGPDYAGDFEDVNGKIRLTLESASADRVPKEVVVYGESSQARHLPVAGAVATDAFDAPALKPWEMATASAPAAIDFPDANWLGSQQPLQLGADGDPTAYGWYRASFDAPADGNAKLDFSVSNNAVVFVNGALIGDTYDKRGISLKVKAGRNNLAIFVSFRGRSKAFDYIEKPIDTFQSKGLFKPVTVTVGGQAIPVTGWKLHGGIEAPEDSRLDWKPSPAENLGFPAFFRTEFEAKAPADSGARPVYRISTKGLTRGSVWLNGHNLGRYPEKLKIDGVYLPECWIKDGSNSLVIFDVCGRVPTASVHLWCERIASRERVQVTE